MNDQLTAYTLAIPALYILAIHLMHFTGQRYSLMIMLSTVASIDILTGAVFFSYLTTTTWNVLFTFVVVMFTMRILAILAYWQIRNPATFPRFLKTHLIDYTNVTMISVILIGCCIMINEVFA